MAVLAVLVSINRIRRVSSVWWLTRTFDRLSDAMWALALIDGAWALWWHAPGHPAGFWLLVKRDYAVVLVFSPS